MESNKELERILRMTTYALLDGYLYRVKKKTPKGFSLYLEDSSSSSTTFNVRSRHDRYRIFFLTEDEKCAIEHVLEAAHRRDRRCNDAVYEGSAHTLTRGEDLYTAHKYDF